MRGKQRAVPGRLLLGCFMLLFLLTGSVNAAVDKGSIRIDLSGSGITSGEMAGVEFRIYKVGNAAVDTDEPSFDDTYGITGYPQTAAETMKAIEILQEKLAGEPQRKGITGRDGAVEFTGLERGVYYVEAARENPYGVIQPFLVQLPYYETANGKVTGPAYEIEVQPKASERPEEPEEPKDPVKEVAEESLVSKDEIVYPGQEITYRIWYYNHEVEEARIQIWDKLDPNVEFVSASDGGICIDGEVYWNIPRAESEKWGSVTVTVAVQDGAVKAGKVENQADVQIGNHERQKTEKIPHDTKEPPSDPQPPVKAIAPESDIKKNETVKAGDRITYQIGFYNHHKEAVRVTITDTLDSGVEFLSASDGGTYDETTRVVTWILENIGSKESGNVTLTVQVKEDAEEKVENQASVQIGNENAVKTDLVENPIDPEGPGEPEEPKDPVKEVAEESLVSKDEIVYPGQEITYRIWYYNHEAETARVQIWDELDPNVEFVSASDGGTCIDGEVYWSIPGTEPGKWGSVTVTVEVQAGAVTAGKIENQADVQIGNNEKQKTEKIPHETKEPPSDPQPPVKVIASESAIKKNETVKAGDRITYQIGFYNHHEEAVRVTVTDQLDPGVDFLSASDGGIYDETTRTVTWILENIGPKEPGNVTLVVQVAEDAEEKVENQASVQIGNENAVKTDVVENPIDPEEPVDPEEPKDPVKEVAAESLVSKDEIVYPGQEITYRIWYYNHEVETARVQIWDELDPNVEFVSASDGGTCIDGEVYWNIPIARSGEWGSVTVTVEVQNGAVAAKRIENQADVQIGNNERQETEKVPHDTKEPPSDPQPPVKEIAPESVIKKNAAVKSGDRITYQIGFYNHHEEVVHVTITDELDPGVDFLSASDGGRYDKTTRMVTWTLENVGSRKSGKVTLTVQVNGDAKEKIENQAGVKIGNANESKTDIVKNPVGDPAIPGTPGNPGTPGEPGGPKEPKPQGPSGDANGSGTRRSAGTTEEDVYCPDIRIRYSDPAKTGDRVRMALYMCAAASSLFLLLGILMKRREHD